MVKLLAIDTNSDETFTILELIETGFSSVRVVRENTDTNLLQEHLDSTATDSGTQQAMELKHGRIQRLD